MSGIAVRDSCSIYQEAVILSQNYFYFSLIRKYVSIFGSLFNNMIIQRTNSTTQGVTQIINVPISYAEKEKMLTRVLADPAINRKDSVILPRMSFFLDGFTYDADRMTAANQKYIIQLPDNELGYQFKPVPWAFHFTLWIWTKNNEDATKILEQIVPFFTPAYTVKAFLIPNCPSVDIPIVLKNIVHNHTQDEKFTDRDMLLWELQFSMKAYFYGPVQQQPVIDVTKIAFYEGDGPNEVVINNHAFGVNNMIFTMDSSNSLAVLDQIVDTSPGVLSNNLYTTVETVAASSLDQLIILNAGISGNGNTSALLPTNTIPQPLYLTVNTEITNETGEPITLDYSNSILSLSNENTIYGVITSYANGGQS